MALTNGSRPGSGATIFQGKDTFGHGFTRHGVIWRPLDEGYPVVDLPR